MGGGQARLAGSRALEGGWGVEGAGREEVFFKLFSFFLTFF